MKFETSDDLEGWINVAQRSAAFHRRGGFIDFNVAVDNSICEVFEKLGHAC